METAAPSPRSLPVPDADRYVPARGHRDARPDDHGRADRDPDAGGDADGADGNGDADPTITPTLGPADFTLGVAPSTQVLSPGGDPALMSISLGSLNAFHDVVQLSVSGLPSGVTGEFTPSSLIPSGVATLRLSAAANAATTAGDAVFTITASGGGISHSTPARDHRQLRTGTRLLRRIHGRGFRCR